MKTAKLKPGVLKDVLDFMVDNHKAKDHGDAIKQLESGLFSSNEVFDMWLCWNGIINWTDQITAALDNIRGAHLAGLPKSKPIKDEAKMVVKAFISEVPGYLKRGFKPFVDTSNRQIMWYDRDSCGYCVNRYKVTSTGGIEIEGNPISHFMG